MISLIFAPLDRRSKHIVLTEVGLRKIAECKKLWRIANDRFENAFGAEAALSFRGTLDRISAMDLKQDRKTNGSSLSTKRVPRASYPRQPEVSDADI